MFVSIGQLSYCTQLGVFDISLLQRIGPLLAKQQWPGLYLHALAFFTSIFRVLVTLLWLSLLTLSLPLYSIYALSVTTLQLFGVQYPLSFCAGMVLVQLGLHFSLKRHMDNSAGSFVFTPLSVFEKSPTYHKTLLKPCGEQAQGTLTTMSDRTLVLDHWYNVKLFSSKKSRIIYAKFSIPATHFWGPNNKLRITGIQFFKLKTQMNQINSIIVV